MSLDLQCNTQIPYTGNGSQTAFEIDFDIYNEAHVYVAWWSGTANEWVTRPSNDLDFGYTVDEGTNESFVIFNQAPENGQRILIYRLTPVDQMRVDFEPGRPIKAQDLDDNFNQLADAIEDTRCVLEGFLDDLDPDDIYWKKAGETLYSGHEWQASDCYIASTAALENRIRALITISDTAPPSPNYPGELWWNSEIADLFIYYYDGDSYQWVSANNSIGDAQSDGEVYGRRDRQWVRISGSGESGNYLSLSSTAGNQTVASSGMTTFNGSVTSGGFDNTQDNRRGARLNKDGSLLVQRRSTDPDDDHLFRGFQGTSENISFTADGSARFSGRVGINRDPDPGARLNVQGTIRGIGLEAYSDTDDPQNSITISLNGTEGTASFDGITEHIGGIKVTGEMDNVTKAPGIYYSSNSLTIEGGGADNTEGGNIISNRIRTNDTSNTYRDFVAGQDEWVFTNLFVTQNDVAADYRGVSATLTSTAANIPSAVGFYTGCSSSRTNINSVYGFHSKIPLSNTASQPRYNFYSDGTAPNYFCGETRVTNTPDFRFDSNNNSNEFGTTLTRGGFLLNRFADNNPSTIGCQFKRLGNADPDTATHSIAAFIYGNQTRDDSVVTSAHIRMDGTGGIILGAASDYRAKENIVDLPSAVDTIKALRPVNYNYTWAPGRTRPGFVAHELQEALPVAVTGTKDATEAIGTLYDFDGTVLETEVTEPPAEAQSYVTEEGETRVKSWIETGTRPVYQGVDQTKLIPLLTKALQEALERIEALEADHATLMNGGNNNGY